MLDGCLLGQNVPVLNQPDEMSNCQLPELDK